MEKKSFIAVAASASLMAASVGPNAHAQTTIEGEIPVPADVETTGVNEWNALSCASYIGARSLDLSMRHDGRAVTLIVELPNSNSASADLRSPDLKTTVDKEVDNAVCAEPAIGAVRTGKTFQVVEVGSVGSTNVTRTLSGLIRNTPKTEAAVTINKTTGLKPCLPGQKSRVSAIEETTTFVQNGATKKETVVYDAKSDTLTTFPKRIGSYLTKKCAKVKK